MSIETKNPLGEQPVNRLLSQFAIPSIISMLVGSLYNIVDQFFIGQRVGELGNAATNIAFPLSTSCLALALLIGLVVRLHLIWRWGAEMIKRPCIY